MPARLRRMAAGYGLKEQSAEAMGSAYAGAAANSADAGALSYNPASLAGVVDDDAAISLVEIVPHSSAAYAGATTSAGTPAGGNAAPRGFISRRTHSRPCHPPPALRRSCRRPRPLGALWPEDELSRRLGRAAITPRRPRR